MMKKRSIVIIFGSSGSIGSEIVYGFQKKGFEVWAAVRDQKKIKNNHKNLNFFYYDSDLNDSNKSFEIFKKNSVDAIVWAQGKNLSDNIYDLNFEKHLDTYKANVLFILNSLHSILQLKLLKKKSRICIISSIWQNLAKANKLSYCISKSALQGLVSSLSIDLGNDGILVNAILPGAIDSPMTRRNLSKKQIDSIKKQSPLNSLATNKDIVELVCFLCSSENSGITGQFIAADRGFSNARIF
jgi:3-oxoacyl-[acyl-carrier protein] reductase